MSDTAKHTLDDTVVSQPQGQASLPPPAISRRSTVLPRVEWKGEKPDVAPFEQERFEELHQLGKGGMGEVVLLKDNDIERLVALKRLPQGAGADQLLRFVKEIRTVGQLDHPNIVPVHDVGVDDRGRYYFVMKHLQGETLESIIRRLQQGDPEAHAHFTFQRRTQIFLSILQALAYAHRKGFIHRDLKPANIMVGPFGEVTVMDWGLARRMRSSEEPERAGAASPREVDALQTQEGSVLGTPLYMSPEQVYGEHSSLDARSDVYSLCVLFHELLFLRHYLEGRKSLNDILNGVLTVLPEVLDYHPPAHQQPVPPELCWFVHKGLAKDPAQRYPSVDEMMQALQKLLEGQIRVQCQRTFLKRALHELLHVIDRYPRTIIIFSTAMASLLLGLLVNRLLGLLGW
jgi:eukaryotic-like serine/threonine-protein kinase